MATGMMIDGEWTLEAYKSDSEGRFQRQPTRFHHRISRDGTSDFPAESGRYHLYVSYACPWAHRTLITRALLGLESAISVSVVNPLMINDGWTFDEYAGATPDSVHGFRYLREVYAHADARYTGRVTVPILWDKVQDTIVNNESREIIRMLDHEMVDLARTPRDLCPPALQAQIDDMIGANYHPVNNGVYRAGFATSQRAYDEAIGELFARLEVLNDLLSRQPWLLGETLTEADICLFPTLIRFDPVYYVHFKCSQKHIWDLPHLWNFMKRFYHLPGVKETVNFHHIIHHYFESHPHINPRGIVAVAPPMEALLER